MQTKRTAALNKMEQELQERQVCPCGCSVKLKYMYQNKKRNYHHKYVKMTFKLVSRNAFQSQCQCKLDLKAY